MSKDLRSTGAPLIVYPLVSPTGQFVFSPVAKNLRDGLIKVEMVDDVDVVTLSAVAAKRGFKTIDQVADTPAKAKELFDGLVSAFGTRRGQNVPDHLLPKAVQEMRKKRSTEKVPFGGRAPKNAPKAQAKD